jgi:hypothetical protein
MLEMTTPAPPGAIIASDEYVHDEVARGELVPVLEEFSPPFPGFYLYYPQRRHASPALRAFVDYLRGVRQDGPHSAGPQHRHSGSRSPRPRASRAAAARRPPR